MRFLRFFAIFAIFAKIVKIAKIATLLGDLSSLAFESFCDFCDFSLKSQFSHLRANLDISGKFDLREGCYVCIENNDGQNEQNLSPKCAKSSLKSQYVSLFLNIYFIGLNRYFVSKKWGFCSVQG